MAWRKFRGEPVTISVRVDESVYDKLDELSERYAMTLSDLLRWMIERQIEALESADGRDGGGQ